MICCEYDVLCHQKHVNIICIPFICLLSYLLLIFSITDSFHCSPSRSFPILVYFKEMQTPEEMWNVGPGEQANSEEAIAKGAGKIAT